MPIFKEIQKGKLKKLNSFLANKEKEIQALVEANLMEVLEMHLLASEYTTTFGGRIDTLAVDINGAPIIIEYKRNKNDNVINQGLSYLRWLQAQKVEFFEMLIIKKLGQDVARSIQIDWKNPRVICIAENYNKFDIDTVEVVPMRIELYKYRYYEGGIFSLDPLNITEQNSKSELSKDTSQPTTIDYRAEDHLAKASAKTRELFQELRIRIFELDENIVEKATTMYVAYRMTKNFAEIHIQKQKLKIHLRPANFDDPKGMVDKIPDGYNWTMDRRIYLSDESELDYVFGIIEQSYKDVI